jgi:hypothetical protein
MSKKSSPFPSKEGELNNYFIIAVAYLIANDKRLGVSATNKQKIIDGLANWSNTYKICLDPNTRTTVATKNKDEAKKTLIASLRSVFNDIPQSALTNQDRETLGIKPKGGKGSPAPKPTSKPIADVDRSKRLEHTIHFYDSELSGTAKPDGVHGCQIWYCIGEEPKTIDDLKYLATDTKSPYVHHFDIADAGKTVWYWLRWENTRNETGPWSDAISATIPG